MQNVDHQYLLPPRIFPSTCPHDNPLASAHLQRVRQSHRMGKGGVAMTMTLKYCSGCSGRLSRVTPTTPKETQLYWARLSRHGAAAQESLCDNCGQHEVVTMYRLLC